MTPATIVVTSEPDVARDIKVTLVRHKDGNLKRIVVFGEPARRAWTLLDSVFTNGDHDGQER